MSQNPEEKQQIEFNDDYDQGLMQTAHARIMQNHLEEMYPRVYEKMSYASMIEAYIEPKIMKQINLEGDYRRQGYPSSGVQEMAFSEITALIKSELQPYEDEEFLNEFDLDIYPIIDTEAI